MYVCMYALPCTKTKENKTQTKDVTEPQRILWKVIHYSGKILTNSVAQWHI